MIDKQAIYDMIEAGISEEEIAAQVGCSKGYVSDLARRKYGKKPKHDTGRIKALWRAGFSINQIMEDTHLSEEEVRRVVIHGKE